MGYDVDIERLGFNAIIDLQGNPDDIKNWVKNGLPPFPTRPNTASHHDGLTLCWVAPERWLLRTSLNHEDRLLKLTRPEAAPVDVSIVPISDSQQFFSITGSDAVEIISIASSIDHHPSAFPRNAVSYTDIFGIKGLLLRMENGFEIAVESSYADMISDCLQRANA